MKVRFSMGAALGLLLSGMLVAPAPATSQGPDGRWPLQPSTGVGRIVAPFLEGWYHNDDGTYTYSFGYNNWNEDTIELPVGETNFIDPARYNGMQPTVFLRGKHRGVFAITVPASERDMDIWWSLTNPNGEVTRVPGRNVWTAYQLDWNPRPHGSLPPAVSFDDGNDEVGRGPPGVMSQDVLSTQVGSPVEISVYVEDVSINDPDDYRLADGTELRVTWRLHQAPIGGAVEFTRHESTPEPERPEDSDDAPAQFRRGPGPEMIPVQDAGTASVYAAFSVPGEYVLRGEVDNFRRPDSGSGDQCCWTNAYVRVNVTE